MSRARRLSSGSYSRRIRVGKSEWETGGRPAHRAEPASSMPMTCDSTGSASWRSGCVGAGRSNSIERSPAGRAASRDGRSWPAFSVFFLPSIKTNLPFGSTSKTRVATATTTSALRRNCVFRLRGRAEDLPGIRFRSSWRFSS